jgi:methanogenic corrinoid protein MtbC1
MASPQQIAAELSGASERMVEKTVAALYRRHPAMKQRYGPAGRQRCREDIEFHFRVLTESVLAADENIVLKYVGWGKSVLIHRRVKTDDLIDCLLLMQDVIGEELGLKSAQVANAHIELAVDTFDSFADMPPSCIDPSSSLANIANSYLEALLSSDREQARKVIDSAARMGTGFPEIYQLVFQPVQREVGRLWQVNQITVAQEHYCTATTEMLMSEVHAREQAGPADGHLFVGACVAGEQHDIGIRMVCEVLETHGWRAYCTGANTPTASLADLVKRLNVAAIGLSCATALYLPVVRQAIAAVRETAKPTKIMVGGRIFADFPGLWKKVGADAFAEDAASAVRVGAKLAGVKATVPSAV